MIASPCQKQSDRVKSAAAGRAAVVPGAAKPASVRVKIRALSKLKAATV